MNEALANTNDSRAADLGANARRSDQLDTGAVGQVSRVGVEPEGLRPTTKPRGEREKQSYAIESALKVLKVLEALEGKNFEPVKIVRVQQRTGFNHNFCLRALRTLQVAGYAKETLDGWILGPKVEALASSLTVAKLTGS